MSAFVEEVDAAAESKNVSLPPKPTAAPASLRTLSKAATFLAAEEAAAAHQSAVVALADPAGARGRGRRARQDARRAARGAQGPRRAQGAVGDQGHGRAVPRPHVRGRAPRRAARVA